MLSVIVPAHNEAEYLNHTIANIYDTATGPIEVLVIDQGGNDNIDERATILTPGENVGERAAMNMGAKSATGTHLFRIDAHCDFSPVGWDELLIESTGPKDLTISVLTATDKSWNRLPGHWYGFARLITNEQGGLECKWQKANKDHDEYAPLEPNMGATGCGMCIRKDFYWEIGGADDTLPKMGAIGEEFAIKTWHHNITHHLFGRVQTRTDVMVGHIFGTGGYDTSGVLVAQQKLHAQYGHVLPQILSRFPDWDEMKIVKTDQPGKPIRTVTVDRTDIMDTHGDEGKILRRKTNTYRYIWLENEHLDESAWTDGQIENKYAPLATLMSETVTYPDDETPNE